LTISKMRLERMTISLSIVTDFWER